jgi:hypothetical protein
MLDVEPVVLEELQRLSPFDPDERGDWDAVLAQAKVQRRRLGRRQAPRLIPRGTRSLLAAGAVVAAVVAAPALAFSTPLRHFFGLEYPPAGPFKATITGISFPKTYRYALPKVTVTFTIGDAGKSPGSGVPNGSTVLVYVSGKTADAWNTPVIATGANGRYSATTLAPPGGIAVVYIVGFLPSLRAPHGVYFSVPVVFPDRSSQ